MNTKKPDDRRRKDGHSNIRHGDLSKKLRLARISSEVSERDIDQVLDAFQQAPEPISTLYTGDFGVGRGHSCPPIEMFHPER